MAHASPELQPELLRTLRLLRRFLWAIGIVAGLFVLFAVVGILFALVSSGDGEPTPGNDVHASLHAGSRLTGITEAGLNVSATVPNWWEGGNGPNIVVKVYGMPPSPERWSLYLEDNTRLALDSEPEPEGAVRLFLARGLPDGAEVRYLHFNPDDSRGDLYFDFP